MTDFREDLHLRSNNGQFSKKEGSEPEVVLMTDASSSLALPEFSVGSNVKPSDLGESRSYMTRADGVISEYMADYDWDVPSDLWGAAHWAEQEGEISAVVRHDENTEFGGRYTISLFDKEGKSANFEMLGDVSVPLMPEILSRAVGLHESVKEGMDSFVSRYHADDSTPITEQERSELEHLYEKRKREADDFRSLVGDSIYASDIFGYPPTGEHD